MQAVRGSLAMPSTKLQLVPNPALLIVRPRAWNMDETVGFLYVFFFA